MINVREHFKLTAVYTFFAGFPALLQLIVYPVIEGEHRLGAIDFGYLAITEAIISVIFVICTFGMGSALSRFYYDFRDKSSDYNKLVSTVISGILGRGMLLMGMVILFAPQIGPLFSQPALQNFGEYGPSLVISGLNRSILASSLTLYRNEKRVRTYVLVSLFSSLFRSGFQLTGVLFFDLSFLGYVHGTAIGGSIVAAVIVIYSYYRCGFHYNRNILRSLFPFVRPLFFTDLLLWGLLFADRFFLLRYPDELGIYDNAMKFAIGVQLIVQGLTNAIQPEIFRYLKEGFREKGQEIRALSSLYIAESISLIVITIVPVMLFITLFYQTNLNLSAGLIMILFARFVLTAQYNIFALPLVYAKKTTVFFYINSGVLLINLVLNFWLTPVYGYYGAIISFFAAYLFQVVLFCIMQQRIMPVGLDRIKVIYYPLGIVFAAILFEGVKLMTGAGPFLVSAIFVVLTLTSMAVLYRRELVRYRGLLFRGWSLNN